MGDLLSAIGNQLLELVVPSLMTAIAGLATAAMVRYLKKLGLELDAQQQQRLSAIVERAIRIVEERARRGSMTSGQKAYVARVLVQEQAPDLAPELIDQAIDAALPLVRSRLAPFDAGNLRTVTVDTRQGVESETAMQKDRRR